MSLPSPKKILFVTYGGGHAAMVERVVQALAPYGFTIEILALTLAGPYFKRRNMPYLGFKDVLQPEDTQALEWGKKLAAQTHRPESGIEEEEAIAYLGLSYWELVQRNGEEEAARRWAEKGRNAFLPISVLERVLDRVHPDMVVTTNSPRAEYAAQLAANRRGIPTLCMYDLFGLSHFHRIESDVMAVISPLVIENLRQHTGVYEGQQFIVTGNPAFDAACDYRGPVNADWRREYFPTIPENAKILLNIDEPAWCAQDQKTWHYRDAPEIMAHLDRLAAAAAKAGGHLLIRPHPSQDRAPFVAWMEQHRHPHVHMAADVPLYPLLNACDAVVLFESTVACEALLVGRPVIQLDIPLAFHSVLVGQWGLAHWLKTTDALNETVRRCFAEGIPPDMQARIDAFFPQGKAAPKIAEAIHAMLEKKALPYVLTA